MKIAIIVPSLHMGGGEKFAVDLSNELSKDPNNHVTLCVISKISKKMILSSIINPNINLISINKEEGFDYKVLFKLKKIIKENRFDVVHTHLRSLFYSSWSIFTIKKMNYVHTFHTLVEKEVKSYLYKILLKLFFNHFKVTPIAITPEVLKGIQRTFGKNHKTMILNGVSPLKKTHKFQAVKKEISSYKKNSETKVFMNIARVSEVKNQKLLIESFKHLNKNAILIIIGSLQNEPKYAKESQELAKMSNNIFILGEKNNIGDYLYCCDALCLSSTFEGLPLVILEAMSIGKATLSTNVGGIPDVIINNVNGYLSQGMLREQYIDILNKSINNSPINSEEIFSLFKKKYSMEICKNHYYKLYQTIVNKD